MRFKKSTFWVQKVHFCGFPHLPKIDTGYSLGQALEFGYVPLVTYYFIVCLVDMSDHHVWSGSTTPCINPLPSRSVFSAVLSFAPMPSTTLCVSLSEKCTSTWRSENRNKNYGELNYIKIL